jgi:FKBP-type peptidyl-prolyl cis-trans isomerase FklB
MFSSLRSAPIRQLAAIAGLATLALVTGCGDSDAKKTASAQPANAGLATDEQKFSYGIGYKMGRGAAEQAGLTIDKEAMKAGLEDGLAKAKTRVPEADLDKAFGAIQQRLQSLAAAEAEKQLAAGNDFLAKNKARKGVKATASGLQYEVLKGGGKGPKPKPTDTVEVTYHGTLVDGTVFDSSVERGDTATFALNGVIPGWTEALQLMAVGDKFKLFIPPNLAYGPQARGKIPANAVLVFEVELKQIK